MLDAKYAAFAGLSHSLMPRSWDTKEPKNLNDADLFPTATEPFQDREGPTEMIFCLITNKIAKFLVDSPGIEMMMMIGESWNTQSSNPHMVAIKRTIEKLGTDLLEVLDKYCDPTAGPVHEMAIEIRSQIIGKLTEMITPPSETDEVRNKKDNAFKLAVSALEHNEKNIVSMKDKGFLWFTLLHFQVDVFLYLAGQLCNRTEGKLVERAWRQVGVVYTYHPELLDLETKMYARLARFILKAWDKREQVKGGNLEVPVYIIQLRNSLLTDDSPNSSSQMPDSVMLSTPTDVQLPTPDPSFDQYLGGFLDVSSLDWDMFGSMPAPGQQAVPFAGFGMGPSANW
jgi:hypothetical protein